MLWRASTDIHTETDNHELLDHGSAARKSRTHPGETICSSASLEVIAVNANRSRH